MKSLSRAKSASLVTARCCDRLVMLPLIPFSLSVPAGEARRNTSPGETHRIKPDKGGGNQSQACTHEKRGAGSAPGGGDWAVAMTVPAAASRRANSNYFGGSCREPPIWARVC